MLIGAEGANGAAGAATETRFTASDAANANRFGSSVALARDRALIGAYGDDPPETAAV